MNQVNQPQNAIRRSVSEHYLDLEGKEQTRASGTDFDTLTVRHHEAIFNLRGFQQDKELLDWFLWSTACYDQGEYAKVIQYLKWSLRKMPALEPYYFYYVRICEHVLSIPLAEEESYYELEMARYKALPKWLKWTMRSFELRMRCKWCGRYTRYINPDVPTFGINTSANSCSFCNRMYPMPSWLWDSPDGRAYSYYRMSFRGNEFYEEFERDYDPTPLCQSRRNLDSSPTNNTETFDGTFVAQFKSVQGVKVICPNCETSYTVTLRRHETKSICPHCGISHTVDIDWQ